MDSAPSPSSPDVEISTPLLVSMVPSSDTKEENVNQGLECGRKFANRRNLDRASVHDLTGLKEGELSFYYFVLALVFWIDASLFVIGVISEPETVSLGPNSSILFKPNSILVKSLKVKEVDYSKSTGLQLFGFYRSPPLDVFVNWSESRLLTISHQSDKAWPYYLNNGTSLNISYTVKPQGYGVQLAVKGGPGSMVPYAPWSWNLIQGSGMIQVEKSKTSTYYVSLTNLKMKDVECTFNVISLAGNSVVVTSPAPSQRVSNDDEWYIELSYQPRYMAFVIGGGMWMCVMLVATRLYYRTECCGGERRRTENDSARTRLIANKDGNGSSMGSSTESSAKDDADLEEFRGNVVKQVTAVEIAVPFVMLLHEIAFSSRVAIASPVINAAQR